MMLRLLLLCLPCLFVASAIAAPDDVLMRERVRAFVDEARSAPAALVAVSGPGGRRVFAHGDAGDGAPPDADTWFEAGSITKGLTGLLLAQMAHAGEVRLNQPIGELYPREHAPPPAIAAITLEELATHHSGLPRLALSPRTFLRLMSADPYAGSTAGQVLREGASQPPGMVGDGRGTFGYSNLGFALLGQLLAARAGMPYEVLLSERVFAPLGLPAPVLDPAGIAGRRARGYSNGRPTSAWHFSAYAPAGGLQTTADQLLDLGEALLAADEPWVREALQPRRSVGTRSRAALGWVHTPRGDTATIWHNGGTGGFSSLLMLLPDSGEVIVAFANGGGGSGADELVFGLYDPTIPPPQPYRASWSRAGLTLLGLLAIPAMLMIRGPGARTRVRRPPDRLDTLSQIAGTLVMLMLLRSLGDWVTFGFWMWWVAAAAVLLSLPLVLWQMRPQPWPRGPAAWLRAAAIVAMVLIVWVMW